jgi:hypothetical protein
MADSALPEGVADTINTKVAGLPLWGWVAVAAGGVLLVRRVRGRTTTAATSDTTTTDAGTQYDTSLPSLGAPASTAQPMPDTSVGDSQRPAIADNDEWRRVAFTALTARNYDALAVDAALTAYLASKRLTQAQAAIVGAALSLVGPTPTPVQLIIQPPGSNPKPTPAPKPPPTPAPKPTEKRPPLKLPASPPTPWSLVRTTYGKVNAGMVSRFAAYNGLAYDGKQVTPWAAGQTVRFPATL